MSLGVPSVAPIASTASLNAASLLTNLSLTTAQQAQIAEVMAELQTGSITSVQARAQIDSILAAQAQGSTGHSPETAPAASSGSSEPLQTQVQNLQSYYEMPLPQEKLAGGALSAYTWSGASNTSGGYTAPQHVNQAA